MSWRKVELSTLLIQIKHIVKIDNSKEYKLVTVSSKGTITQREIVKGVEIKGEKAFEAKSGKFIYSRLSVHNGAFGIVPLELDGALLTSEMPIFEISDKILPEFLIYSLQLPTFKFQLEQLTKGVGRTRVKEANFLSLIIDLPNISDQETIIKSLIKAEQHSGLISSELIHQLTLVKKLRQQLLQDAVQGKLVEQNKNDEPASELLKKIKTEKQKLISEKKLKKEKELPPIKPEEIPFKIPENWIWCRGEIVASYIDPQPSHRTPPESQDGVPYIAMSDIKKDGSLDFNSARKVSKTTLEEHQNRYKLQDGDFIFGKIGTIGKPVKLPNPFNYTLSANVILIQPERRIINQDYLFYFLSSPASEKNLIENKSTMSYPVFGMGKARNMPIPLPPLAEQNRIVKKLDELMKYCNELAASIKESESQNEKLLQQVLREALRKEPVEV